MNKKLAQKILDEVDGLYDLTGKEDEFIKKVSELKKKIEIILKDYTDSDEFYLLTKFFIEICVNTFLHQWGGEEEVYFDDKKDMKNFDWDMFCLKNAVISYRKILLLNV